MDLQIALRKKIQELAIWCESNKIWATIVIHEEKKPQLDKTITTFVASIKEKKM